MDFIPQLIRDKICTSGADFKGQRALIEKRNVINSAQTVALLTAYTE